MQWKGLKSDFSINLNHLDIFLLIKLPTLMLTIYENEQKNPTFYYVEIHISYYHQNNVLSEI